MTREEIREAVLKAQRDADAATYGIDPDGDVEFFLGTGRYLTVHREDERDVLLKRAVLQLGRAIAILNYLEETADE